MSGNVEMKQDVATGPILTGAAVIDYDGDGFEDFVVQKGLFRNVNGEGRFVDVTKEAFGKGDALAGGTGYAAADLDNDGHTDLIVVRDGDDLAVYINQGDGTFKLVETTGLKGPVSALSIALADTDGNGCLDVFISARGDPPLKPKNRRNFENRFYKAVSCEAGNLVYEDATEASGLIDRAAEGTLAVAFNDFDKDGDLDLFAYNGNLVEPEVIQTPVVLYENDGKGKFTDVTEKVGLSKYNGYWMGVAFGDYSRNGFLDHAVTNLGMKKHKAVPLGSVKDSPNAVLMNDGDGHFVEGLSANRDHELFMDGAVQNFEFGWGAIGADWNLDTFDDWMYVGAVPLKPLLYSCPGRLFFTHALPGYRGKTYFKESSEVLNIDMSTKFTSGAAMIDVNNDNFADILVATAKFGKDVEFLGKKFGTIGWEGKGEPIVLLNKGNSNNGICIRLQGKKGSTNRDAIGARVEMFFGPPAAASVPAAVREVRCGSSFASTESKRLLFGLGDDKAANFRVVWPSGLTEYHAAVKTRAECYQWVEGDGHSQLAGVAQVLKGTISSYIFGDREKLEL
eukprot:CAMPEP_0203755268 /NCGR_PEP_ID=MMETSP0098-20131031/8736_1 /ASSEMBLY_ACC=CAM_ASM_000208 /TAXON_ID=96639 /ORGANISM=" , Strain NY0313808BC1" /LENGTH=564 /DNA_ID=CAMNT_0050646643 /DNA_START=96 /DNA_END=1790 /DNA_ORIENTATION=-